MELEQEGKRIIQLNEEIAVLMATYNGEKYLAEQIDSLLNQTFQNWHLYIHDDGSKDGTVSLLKKYKEKNPDKITIIDAPPTGSAKNNFIFLLNKVEAPYIMFCDQDDVWVGDKIEKTYLYMKRIEGNKPALVFTDLQVVDQSGYLIAPRMSRYQKLNLKKNKPEDFLAENVVTGCTVMINREMAALARKAVDPSRIIMHDWWMAIIAARFGVISCLDEPLIQYRQHEVNSIGAKKLGKDYIIQRVTHQKDVRNALKATQIQARYVAEVFHLGEDDVITQYGQIAERSKPERLQFYARNHIRKSGIARNIGLTLWG